MPFLYRIYYMNEINNYNTSTNIINCYLYSITNQEMYKALVMCSVK